MTRKKILFTFRLERARHSKALYHDGQLTGGQYSQPDHRRKGETSRHLCIGAETTGCYTSRL